MTTNDELFARAQRSIPGGVNSPVRAFRSVGGTPRFVARAQGAHFWDAEGTRYIDYIGSWGPMIVGHAHPDVVRAVQDAAARGLSYGAPTEAEVAMAEELIRLVPSMQQVRLVSSGTEATMSAIRLARGAAGDAHGKTAGRRKIVKFEGCYHGHADSLLVKAGSGLLTFGNPSSAGVPAEITQHTLVLDYNEPQQLEDAFKAHGDDIACVIVEPVAGNMNLVRPTMEFLQAMRRLCTQYGALLVFDEVMTGFRVALGGAQALFGITPDLTVLGKVIGGGMPVAAFGGRNEVMKFLAPLGPVYQAGTLSGNPVAVACGMATLKLIQRPGFYEDLGARTTRLCKVSRRPRAPLRRDCRSRATASAACSASTSAPRRRAPTRKSWPWTRRDSTPFSTPCWRAACTLAPSAFEAGFVSAAHDDAVIDATLAAAAEAFAAVR